MAGIALDIDLTNEDLPLDQIEQFVRIYATYQSLVFTKTPLFEHTKCFSRFFSIGAVEDLMKIQEFLMSVKRRLDLMLQKQVAMKQSILVSLQRFASTLWIITAFPRFQLINLIENQIKDGLSKLTAMPNDEHL